MTSVIKKLFIFISLSAVFVSAYQWGNTDGQAGRVFQIVESSIAADSPPAISPVKARARDFYAPNTEDLGPDEMRLIACGTGMPRHGRNRRPHAGCSN